MMNPILRSRLRFDTRLRGRLASSALVLVAAVGSGGCNHSPWKNAFQPSGETVTSAAFQGSVKVREVPWERVQGTLSQLYAELVASDVPEADMPESQRAARKASLLRGLQVTADPRTVEILGRSEFRSTDRVRPDDGNRYDWGGVCLGWRLLELQHMQVRQEWMPAGGAEAPHWHARAHQFFYVLGGHLRLSTPDQDVLLEAGQGVHVPAGTRHIAANGGDEDVNFLVFSSPSTQGDRIESASAAKPDRRRDEEPAS